MRPIPIWLVAVVVLALLALPSVAAAAPVRGPSASDVRQKEPGVSAGDAACIARFYDGRLARADWLAPYFTLTPAQKRTATAGLTRCMTREERVAMRELDFTRVLGRHVELRCVANRLEARSWAVRLAVTTRLLELRMYDRVFRACGMTGVMYKTFGAQAKLGITPAEQRSTNRIGSVIPLDPPHAGGTPTKIDLAAVGDVFDRCVGRASDEAMWLRMVGLGNLVPATATGCVVKRLSRSVTFVMLYTDGPEATRRANLAAAACNAR